MRIAGKFLVLLSSGIMMLAVACEKSNSEKFDTKSSLVQIPTGFPAMPFPNDNAFSEARWRFGKKLFFDPVLSIDSTLSCGSCHKPHLAFADDQAFSPGVFNRPGVRNAPSLANVGYHPYLLREGSIKTLEMQVLVPIQEHNEFAHDMLAIIALLENRKDYQKLSVQAYQSPPTPFTITRALGTYQRSLISGQSTWDKYFYQGKEQALSESEKRGWQLFNSAKTNCSSCHAGFNFSNYSFQNNGLDTAYLDLGRARLTGLSSDQALFKVPSLRNVEFTTPYMHNGQFNTLLEVVNHYNSGGENHPNKSALITPLNLNESEKSDLVNFLLSLSDHHFIATHKNQ